MTQNTPREILLALLRSEPVTSITPEDWQKVAALARQHNVMALLYRQLKTLGLKDQVPSNLLQELRNYYLSTAGRNMRFYYELSRVFERFQGAGIPGILLKGAYLAECIYGDIAARYMSDVDLLVRESDVAHVGEILLELDYNRMPDEPGIPVEKMRHFAYRNASKGLQIEVHWTLIDQIYPIHVDIDALWEGARATLVAGIPVREMLPEDQVLHLCVHASYHLFEFGLCAMCDLAETLRHYQGSLDWECLRQRAALWNARHCVYVNLRLARELLNAPVPDDRLNILRPANFEPRYLDIAKEHLFVSVEEAGLNLPSWHTVVEFWEADSLRRKVGLLWQRLFLSRQDMALKYGLPPDSRRVFLYYPVRMMDLLRKNSHVLWRLLRGDQQMLSLAEEQDKFNVLSSWLFSG